MPDRHWLPFRAAARGVCFLIAALAAQPSIAAVQQGPEQGVSAQGQAGQYQQPAQPVPLTVPQNYAATDTAADAANQRSSPKENNWPILVEAISAFMTMVFTGVLALATARLWNSTKGLHDETKRLKELAEGQSADMKASIAESAKAATAMGKVAVSMATNAAKVVESVGISREIADRQKQITELQSRAYLGVQFLGVAPQNRDTGVTFEPRVNLVNLGNTPAYDVKYSTRADVLASPLDAGFDFPLPELTPTSSFIAPRLSKTLGSHVPHILSEEDSAQVLLGTPRRIFMWGYITYKDAFGIERFVRFSQSYFMLTNKTWMSTDTNRHNDAD